MYVGAGNDVVGLLGAAERKHEATAIPRENSATANAVNEAHFRAFGLIDTAEDHGYCPADAGSVGGGLGTIR